MGPSCRTAAETERDLAQEKIETLLQRAEAEAEVWHRHAADYRSPTACDVDTAVRCEIRAYEWECIADMLRDALRP